MLLFSFLISKIEKVLKIFPITSESRFHSIARRVCICIFINHGLFLVYASPRFSLLFYCSACYFYFLNLVINEHKCMNWVYADGGYGETNWHPLTP